MNKWRQIYIKIEELDVIKTKDGREGTVVHIFDVKDFPRAYEVEFDDGEIKTIQEEEISEVIWQMAKHQNHLT